MIIYYILFLKMNILIYKYCIEKEENKGYTKIPFIEI